MRELDAVDSHDHEGAVLDAAVRLVAGAIQDRDVVLRQALERASRVGWLA